MSTVSEDEWARMVREYEAADDRALAAFEALERLPPVTSGGTEEERAYDEARDIAYAHEDGLLAVAPPSLGAAAYQLKIFAVRHHSIEMDDPMPGEERREESVLRRIYDLLISAEVRGHEGLARRTPSDEERAVSQPDPRTINGGS